MFVAASVRARLRIRLSLSVGGGAGGGGESVSTEEARNTFRKARTAWENRSRSISRDYNASCRSDFGTMPRNESIGDMGARTGGFGTDRPAVRFGAASGRVYRRPHQSSDHGGTIRLAEG